MKMKSICYVFAALMLLAAVTVPAGAAALDKNILPADTQWVVHMDVDLFNKTALKQAMVDKHNAFKKAEEKIFRETRVNLFKDLSAITIFGNKQNSHQLVFCVKGNLDKTYLLGQLKKAHEYKEVKYGKHTLYQWKHSQNGVFIANHTLLYSRDENALKQVLDLMKGKGKSIKGTDLSRYIGMIPGNAFAFAAASDISGMAKRGYPGTILKQTGMASFLAMENNKNFTMKVLLNSNTEENARNIENILRGLMAVANMARHNDHGDDEHKDHKDRKHGKRHDEEKTFLKLLDKVELKSQGKTVHISFTYPSEALVDLLKGRRGFHFH